MIDPNWFLKLKDETRRIPFKEWDTIYEEVVARTVGRHNIRERDYSIRVLFEFIRVIFGPCLSSLSNLSLRNSLSLSYVSSRM